MELVSPAAIAHWSALNYHGMTEQLPRTVFVATNRPLSHPPKEALGIEFKIVALRPTKFFGIVRDWVDEQPFWITDKEKTIIDGLDLPRYVGGVGEIAKVLASAWEQLDEAKLREYAGKIGNSAVAKRQGPARPALGTPGECRGRPVITAAELYRTAAADGLRFDQAEKDYVILWILQSLSHPEFSSKRWVFKGGTFSSR